MTPESLRTRLQEAYPDGEIEVVDLTGTQDHYAVHIRSQAFTDLSRIQRHQSVMAVFQKELESGEVHALTIRAEAK